MSLTSQKKLHKKHVRTDVQQERRPDWLKVRLSASEEYKEVSSLVDKFQLNTVCQSARCPNIGECWGHRTATFMILGNTCTRSCGFCAVKTGMPSQIDPEEPDRVAEAVQRLGLKHIVLTSVNRDELPDGGAQAWANVIRAVRNVNSGCRIEVLVPDFKGSQESIDTVLESKPDVFNHNTETVKRLYASVRPQANYQQTLDVLRYAADKGALTKSGIMVGIGESTEEVIELMEDVRATGCSIMTIGQYLQPSRNHLPVHRFVTPAEFDYFREQGLAMGFSHVESGPLVRSSYHAHKQVPDENDNKGD